MKHNEIYLELTRLQKIVKECIEIVKKDGEQNNSNQLNMFDNTTTYNESNTLTFPAVLRDNNSFRVINENGDALIEIKKLNNDKYVWTFSVESNKKVEILDNVPC